MGILYTHFELLSTVNRKKMVPRRNLIPGGRTRPQRVKFNLLAPAKIISNYNAPAPACQD